MTSNLVKTAFCAVVLLSAAAVDAHTRWEPNGLIVPRSDRDNLKSGPCGGIPRGDTLNVFEPGETIEVAFRSEIFHNGVFRISFSPANDQGFKNNVLIDDIQDKRGEKSRTATITLPNTACEDCTLQLVQTMPDRNPPSDYFSCANIALRAPMVVKPDPVVFELMASSAEGDSVMLSPATGLVTVSVQVAQQDSDRQTEYSWIASDNRLVDLDGAADKFVFDTASLAEGEYKVAVTLIDKEFTDVTSSQEIVFSLLPDEPTETAAAAWRLPFVALLLGFLSLRVYRRLAR